jgi:murein DD-endopeptidase MepM/ murein hydrolase activator NlpD
VVAFVGASGLATGPHLHYEVFEGGRRVDPRLASAIDLGRPDPGRDAAFRSHKAMVDAAIAAMSDG